MAVRWPDIDLVQVWSTVVLVLPSAVVGLVVAVRRPDNVVGPLISLQGTLFALMFAWQGAYDDVVLRHPGALPASAAVAALERGSWMVLYVPVALVMLTFPSGHVLTRRWWWVAVGLVAAATLFTLIATMSPHRLSEPFAGEDNPFGPAPTWLRACGWALLPVFLGLLDCQRRVDGATSSPLDRPCGAGPGALARAGSVVTAGDAAAVLAQPAAHRPTRPGCHRPCVRRGRDPRRRSCGDAATRPVRRRPRPQRGRHLLSAEWTAADGLHRDRGRPRDPAGPGLGSRGGDGDGPRGRRTRPGPAASSAHDRPAALPDARRAPPEARRPASRHRHRRGAARGHRVRAAACVAGPRVAGRLPGARVGDGAHRIRSAGQRRGAGDVGRHPDRCTRSWDHPGIQAADPRSRRRGGAVRRARPSACGHGPGDGGDPQQPQPPAAARLPGAAKAPA